MIGKPSIAVLYAPGSAGIREFQALDDRYGIVFVVDPGEPYASVLRLVGDVITVPSGERELLVHALSALDLEAITTFADSRLVEAAAANAALGLPGMTVQAARRLQSKYHQRIALNEAGVGRVLITRIPSPPTLPFDPDAIAYPAVLKPETATAGEDVHPIRSGNELRQAVESVRVSRPFVLESMIRSDGHPSEWLGDWVSVESIVINGEIVHLGISDRPPAAAPFRETGSVSPSFLPANRQTGLEAIAESAIAALNLDNCAVHTEIKLHDDAGTVIEVNGRLGGYVDSLFRHVGAGMPLVSAIEAARGRLHAPTGDPRSAALVYAVPAPVGATRLLTSPTPAELSNLRGVFRVERLLRPGDAVDWRRGSLGRVMNVWLDGPDESTLRDRFGDLTALLEERLAYDWDG